MSLNIRKRTVIVFKIVHIHLPATSCTFMQLSAKYVTAAQESGQWVYTVYACWKLSIWCAQLQGRSLSTQTTGSTWQLISLACWIQPSRTGVVFIYSIYTLYYIIHKFRAWWWVEDKFICWSWVEMSNWGRYVNTYKWIWNIKVWWNSEFNDFSFA